MAGVPPTMLSHRDVPVIINSFNRAGSLRRLVAWLTHSGYRRIIVVDNASEFAPLVRYLDDLERTGTAQVVRLEHNGGHTALWKLGLLDELGIDTEFVYTDPDVVPAQDCPADAVRVLQELLATEPEVFKAGLGLRLDDVPRRYRHRRAVLAWETKNWLSPAAPGCFLAPIDTTFALYRPGSAHGVDELAIRTGPPLVAAHESWYSTGLPLTREAVFYARVAARTPTSTWSRLHLPQWLARWKADYPGLYPRVLLVGGPEDDLPGYVGAARARHGRGAGLALPDDSVDGIYLPAGVGALSAPALPLAELERVAKPGAKVVLHQPWPPPNGDVADGGDVRSLVEWLGAAVAGALEGTAAATPVSGPGGVWRLERLQLVTVPTAGTAPEPPEQASPDEVVSIVAHLRAGLGTAAPEVEITASRLDLHGRFERV